MSGIPKAFFPVLSQFADFSKKRIRCYSNGKDTAVPGEVTTIQLPEGKIDASTICLGGRVTVFGESGLANAPPIEQLIESCSIEVGAVQLHPSFNHYGRVWNILSDLQGTWNKRGPRQILNLQPVAAPVAAAQTDVPFQMSNWLGFLNDINILYSDRMPPIRIMIRWAGTNVLAGAAATTAATYTISGLVCTMDMLKVSPVLDDMISTKIAHSPLTYPYTNYQVIPGVQGTLNNVTRFSTTSDSLQKIWCTFIPTTYLAPYGGQADATTFLSPTFNRGSPNLVNGMTSRVTINGSSYPDVPATVPEQLQSTLDALNETHDITSTPHPNLNSLANFASKFYAHGVSFTYDADGGPEAASRKCGLSALGQTLMGSWETTATAGQTDPVQPLVILETKAVLEVGQHRAARVIL